MPTYCKICASKILKYIMAISFYYTGDPNATPVRPWTPHPLHPSEITGTTPSYRCPLPWQWWPWTPHPHPHPLSHGTLRYWRTLDCGRYARRWYAQWHSGCLCRGSALQGHTSGSRAENRKQWLASHWPHSSLLKQHFFTKPFFFLQLL